MNDKSKDGPIHFYPTADRDSYPANVVEYCVQLGEHQPLTRTQAAHLVATNQVTIDSAPLVKLTERIGQGAWEIGIRGRKHHVIVYPPIME